MTTLPGLASKGEKGKLKYQSLDINNLYRQSRGESLEKQQQKSTVPLKHGMQTLGRVPNTRRGPANLPSLKSEHSGSDSAVSIVPTGGPGWAKQDAITSTATSQSSTSTVTNTNAYSQNSNAVGQQQMTAHQAAAALPITTTIPPPNTKPHPTPTAVTPATSDKSWSSVMSGPPDHLHHPPPYQSPQFQQEFPSLSAGDGATTHTAGGPDIQYGPGPSLRPETEGSWTQGGSRGAVAPAEGPPRSSSAPLGAPPQLSAQVGLAQQPLPPQFRVVMPQFMFRNNFPTNGHSPNNMPPPQMGGRNRVDSRLPPRHMELDEVAHRPIIKEEDLNQMDDIARDVGWATHDDIDYNQKLAFSDDDATPDKDSRKEKSLAIHYHKDSEKSDGYSAESGQRSWSSARQSTVPQSGGGGLQGMRSRSIDEDAWNHRRQQQSAEVAEAVERAKLRKEEEEKRFLEKNKQAAAKKLKELNEKMSKSKREKEADETQGTINPSIVPPQPITPAPIPVPDWEKERGGGRARTPNDVRDGKTPPPNAQQQQLDFRHLTTIEGKIVRKDSRSTDRMAHDRDREMREQNGPSYQRHQSDLPPRFQKLRSASNQPNSQMHAPFQHQPYDTRWQMGKNASPASVGPSSRKSEDDKDREDDRRDFRRQGSDEGFRGPTSRLFQESGRNKLENRFSSSEESRDFRSSSEYEYKSERDEDKWGVRDKDKRPEAVDDDWHIDRHREEKHHQQHVQERYERPQRPDSRDSRASRDSRTSRDSMREMESRDYHDHGSTSSWAEAPFESQFEEKKRDGFKEDRRQVPGPITKERIEADDLRNEKRSLIQLKRGQLPDKKSLDSKKDDKSNEKEIDNSWNIKKLKESSSEMNAGSKSWSDSISPSSTPSDSNKFMDDLEKPSKKYTVSVDSIKEESKEDSQRKNMEKGDKKMPRSRSGWGGGGNSGYIYHRTSWTQRNAGKGSRMGSGRPFSSKGGEWQGTTESEGSADEVSVSTESGKEDRSGKLYNKKFEKDESNKEIRTMDNKNDKPPDKKQDKHENRRDNFVPRGEPSRHGRGGYNCRRGGGMGKRIDGYGPPPSKSPFGHSEHRDSKNNESMDIVQTEDKVKQSQMALSAGLTNVARKESQNMGKTDDKIDRSIGNKLRRTNDGRRGKSRGKNGEEGVESTSENSDDGRSGRKGGRLMGNRMGPPGPPRRNIPRLSGDRRGGKMDSIGPRQNSGGNLRPMNTGHKKDEFAKSDDKIDDGNVLCNAIADISLKNKDAMEAESDDKNSVHGDLEGFQEVKSKKMGKDKKPDDKPTPMSSIKPALKCEKDVKPERKNKSTVQLTQQQISNIPPLMATPVNPPPVLPHTNKGQFGRPKENKLAPRFVKKKESYRQMQQMAQIQQGLCDVSEMNKVNQSMGMYALEKSQGGGVTVPLSNAWDKPLMRNSLEQEGVLAAVGLEGCKVGLEVVQQPQSGSPGGEKVIGKDKSVLDGATPPVNTIIFENTNFKSAPGARSSSRADKPKLDENLDAASVMPGFTKQIGELLNKEKQDSLQIQLAFNSKEDAADMKLDFFESEISHLTEEKGSKNLSMARSMHAITSGNSTISPSTADALNFKIQSVKKVWETMPTVIEHNVVQDEGGNSFSSSFGGPDHNSLDPSGAFGKSTDTADDNHEGYSPAPNQTASNSTTNVCKVKPTQQVAGSGGQAVLSSGTHQQHSGMVGPGLMGHQLSPPPMQPVIGGGVGLGQPPQQYTTNQHISYQVGSASLGGSTQYGMSAIPSPPTVLYNPTQQLQAQTAGLYGHFPIDQTGVIGGQGRSQYSQYPYNLNQTGSSPYSAQSMYLQQTQHPPPSQAPPDLYQNLNSYRLSAAAVSAQFGQNQQLSNPTTMMMSSTSNSLMSATVKPSSQQIGAIGTKASGVGQAYQQQSQQGQQLYMYDPTTMQANYLQRGTAGPVQNNVLQPSSSYYSGSTGGQTGYFQQPTSSTLQSAQLQQHQAGYGLQGSVFGTHSQSHTSPGLQGFNSHFLSTPMQIAAAAVAMNAQQQQYRSQNLPGAAAYLKGVGGDQGGRNQQLKSPGGQQEVLSSVFNSAPQIPSPKSRQNCKQPPPQPSPTSQHKYNLYQGVSGQQGGQAQRYPAPIQRPVNFQPALSSIQNSGPANNQKHRSNNSANKAPQRQYYGGQGANISSQNEKNEDKLGDAAPTNTTNSSIVSSSSIVTKAAIGSGLQSEIAKEGKEEAGVVKD